MGTFTLTDKKFADFETSIDLTAVSYMDTVSEIRGKMGRPELPEKDKTYFMKKKVEYKDI